MGANRLPWITACIGAAALVLTAVRPSATPSPESYWSVFTPRAAVATERFDSLDQMVHSADLVVLAQIRSLSPGREFGDEVDIVHYAAAELDVKRVLHGSLPNGPVILELQLPHGEGATDVPRYARQAPESAAVFILRNKGREATAMGLAADRVAREAPYYRLVTPGALVANSRGKAATAGADAAYLVQLDGMSFDEAVRAISESR